MENNNNISSKHVRAQSTIHNQSVSCYSNEIRSQDMDNEVEKKDGNRKHKVNKKSNLTDLNLS